jgi:hypothetical protein
MNEETKKIQKMMRNIEKTKFKDIPYSKRTKDAFTKGFTLTWFYQSDWDRIHEIFDEYSVDLKHHGPIITKQTLLEAELAREITEQLAQDPNICKMAENVGYPLRNVYPNPKITHEQFIKGTIFIVVLRLIPSFCMHIGLKHLTEFISNGKKYDVLEPIFNQHGTIRDTQKAFEEAVCKMIIRLGFDE